MQAETTPERIARENDESKLVSDPTLYDWDMRLTRTEWTIFWKTRYENSLQRIFEAKEIIRTQGFKIRELQALLDKMPASVISEAKLAVENEAKAKRQAASKG